MKPESVERKGRGGLRALPATAGPQGCSFVTLGDSEVVRLQALGSWIDQTQDMSSVARSIYRQMPSRGCSTQTDEEMPLGVLRQERL